MNFKSFSSISQHCLALALHSVDFDFNESIKNLATLGANPSMMFSRQILLFDNSPLCICS